MLGTNNLLQKVPVPLILEAISKEKSRLVRSILHYQPQANVNTLATCFQQPVLSPQRERVQLIPRTTSVVRERVQLIPRATSVVNKIGSEIRIGKPYIDVTKLKGIEQVEAAPPRTNRGGHAETFPQVSQSLSW
jgi:hypothetical protein